MRLFQGDYRRETVFSDDPLDVALKWQSLGAPRLHIVDLDGAARGEPQNLGIIKDICTTLFIPVQLGGGIRSLETVKALLKAGVDRVVLGTAAIEDPEMAREACRQFRQSIVIGIDALDGCVAIRGWQAKTDIRAADFLKAMIKLGARRFIYTDISRDGTLTEPNFSAINQLANISRFPVIASGGVSTIAHIQLLRQLNLEGAIVGKALYTGDINLKQALKAAE